MITFKALLAARTDKTISTSVIEMSEQDLMPGDVTIAADYSTVNYNVRSTVMLPVAFVLP